MFVTSNPISSAALRINEITTALCWAVGNAIRPGFIQAAMAMLVVRRIQRVRRVLLALEARFLAGVVLRRAARVARVVVPEVAAVMPDGAGVVARVRARGARLPSRLGWLCPLVPSDAACFAGQLRGVLAEPGMQALLLACPQAVRTLGPVCRMLGIARADWVPAGVVPVVRAARVREARVRVSRKRERLVIDPAVEDAHYAFTQVPARFRLRPRAGRGRGW